MIEKVMLYSAAFIEAMDAPDPAQLVDRLVVQVDAQIDVGMDVFRRDLKSRRPLGPVRRRIALPARVAAVFQGHEQAMFEIGIRFGQKALGNRLGDMRTAQAVAGGDEVLARHLARPAAHVGAGVGRHRAGAVDHADLAIAVIFIVGLELVEHRARAEALRQQAQRDRVVVLVGVGLAHRHPGIRFRRVGIAAHGDRKSGDADAEPAGLRAASEDGVGHRGSLVMPGLAWLRVVRRRHPAE
jgi:hypothetical protein